MKRREFLAASALAVSAAMGRQVQAAGPKSDKKQYLELRNYEFDSEQKQKAFVKFLGDAAIGSMNRQGIKSVGVFEEMEAEEKKQLWVLIPHDSMDSVISCNTKMQADKQYIAAGAGILDRPKKDPAYLRFESSLLLGFDQCPNLEIPSKKDTRVFQLRIYESHDPVMAKRKIEMFNSGGEIDIFRDTGLNPVFFGESIVGTRMPNLTYMVGFDDIEAKEKAWNLFKNDPRWQTLRKDPYYKDTVSNITNIILRPCTVSQI